MTASAPQPRLVRRERRIIERPRLIKLLDETEARTILLLAPAGYGKTTLARQWAKTLQSVVWVSLTPRHHDVAWLAADIAEAIDREGDTASRAITEQLNARSNPQRAARQLGVALAEQLNAARVQWLVLDDYHAIDAAPESDELVRSINDHTGLRLLVTSRTRPDWATSKRVVYGELLELNRQQLAMTSAESDQVLERGNAVKRLAWQARGWPALVGLAATVRTASVPNNALPEALHEYLAEELFQRASPELQENLTTLALLGDLSGGALEARFGEEAERIVSEADALGFSSGDQAFELHPLLREFLLEKLVGIPDHEGRVRQAVEANLSADSWDRALELIVRFKLFDMAEQALSLAYKPLTRSGRFGTLSSFAEGINRTPSPPPSIQVVLAEVALRDGNLELARDLAEQAQARLGPAHPLKSRAAAIEAQSCLFLADFERGEAAFASARNAGQDERDEAEALHGVAITGIFGERAHAEAAVNELAARRGRSPIDFIRFVTADLALRRFSQTKLGLNPPLRIDAMRQALPCVDDPRARTAATYQGSSALALRAEYSDAKELLALFSDDAERFDLEFTLPFLNWVKGQVAIGQRRFAEADRALQAIENAAAKAHDRHHEVNARSLRARLFLQNGDAEGAIDCVRVDPLVPLSPSWRAEYLATRAMALACAEQSAQALATADHASGLTKAPEVHVLIQTARAIATVHVSPTETRRLIAMAQRLAMWDAVVCGARSSVDLADSLASQADLRPIVAQLYRRTNDTALARRAGLRTRTTAEPTKVLSPRELEVLNLIALGYRNRDIAQALFIADSTTKVHIRHIFEKLGVRTRSEAVARLQMLED